eukprot:Hpha_TRINITY_DN15345_c0_g1::TRINITY_DN15345_c0_g1_i8::g.91166::m.91166
MPPPTAKGVSLLRATAACVVVLLLVRDRQRELEIDTLREQLQQCQEDSSRAVAAAAARAAAALELRPSPPPPKPAPDTGGGGGGACNLAAAQRVVDVPLTFHDPQPKLLLCQEQGYCVFNASRGEHVPELYLYTLRNSLTGTLLTTEAYTPARSYFSPAKRLQGQEFVVHGLTMTGQMRMESLHDLLHRAYREKKLDGDFLEAGVWRGGSSIYAKGFMEAYGIERRVYVV